MNNLHESNLGQPVLAFAFAFYIIAVLWAEVRRANPKVIMNLQGVERKILVRGRACRVLTMAFTTVVLCFSIYPIIYHSFIPINTLDMPALNLVGITLMAVSLVWTVLAQLDFDDDLQHIVVSGATTPTMDIAWHSKKIVTGYFIMFLGVTLTLANVVSLVLFAIACGIFYRNK
jgi:hypothetical protein